MASNADLKLSEYNKELFLDLATMSNLSTGIKGECYIRIKSNHKDSRIGEILRVGEYNVINSFFRKATSMEIIVNHNLTTPL